MPEGTQTEAEQGTPQGYGYCSWHQRFAAGVRLINHIEQGSGPGGVQYACGPCRTRYGLVPFEDR